MKKLGFTLIELMIVVAIIGILAAIAIPDFLKFQARSRQSEAKMNLSSISVCEMSYFAEHNVWGPTFKRIGWEPMGVAKYRYTLSAGNTQPNCKTTGLDQDCFFGNANCALAPSDTCRGNCLLDGQPPGVSNTLGFTAVAEGNIDEDTTTDCWGVNRVKHPDVSRNDINQ